MRSRILASGLVAGLAATVLAVGGSGVAHADGTSGASASPARTWGTNGRVTAILTVGSSVVLGGDFTSVVDTNGRVFPATRLAKYSPATGTFDTSWQPSTTGTVTALAASGDALYVGGNFAKVDNVSHASVAAVSLATGALLTGFATKTDKQVDSLTVSGSSLYLGGPFTTVTDATGPRARGYAAKVDLATGALDTTWGPTLNGRVRSVLANAAGTGVYVGGDFTTVNALGSAAKLTLLGAATGAVDPTFRSGATNQTSKAPVFAMTQKGNALYVAVAGSGGACARVDATTGATAWSKHGNGDVQSIVAFGPYVYCGGHFSGSASFDGFDREKLAAVDPTTGAVQPFAPVINSALGIWSLGSTPDALLAGGDFTKINAVLQQGVAQFRDLSSLTAAAAPGNLLATAGDSAVALTWDVPSTDGGVTAHTYRVYRSTDGGATWAALGTSNAESFTDATAVNDTTYTYAVLTRNSVGDSPLSSPASATPRSGTLTAPGVPVGFKAASAYLSSQLTWSAPTFDGGSPVTGYRILRSTTSGGETVLTDVSAGTLSYTDSAVTPQVRYYYTLQALNAVGASDAATEQSAVPSSGVPTAPVLSRDTTTPSGVVTLTWTVASEGGTPVTKYVVVRDGIRIAVVNAPTTTLTDPAPLSGSHSYQVKAVNSIGTSRFSNSVVVVLP